MLRLNKILKTPAWECYLSPKSYRFVYLGCFTDSSGKVLTLQEVYNYYIDNMIFIGKYNKTHKTNKLCTFDSFVKKYMKSKGC